MKCTRKPIVVDAVKYEVGKGLEDGFEPLADVITHIWIVTDNLVRIDNEEGIPVCPYIRNRRGRTFIQKGDYIITEPDGSKLVCGEDKIEERYARV